MDKAALGKAIILAGLSWAAVPVLYYMFLKEKKKNDKQNGQGKVGKDVVEKRNDSK